MASSNRAREQPDVAAQRCLQCWPMSGEPPFQHVVKRAGTGSPMPKTKQGIVDALLEASGDGGSRDDLMSLTLKELKWYYQRALGTRPHPCNPLIGASSLRKGALVDLCQLHGIHFEKKKLDSTPMAEMLSQLRQHWEDQCHLVDQQGVLESLWGADCGLGSRGDDSSLAAEPDPMATLQETKSLFLNIRAMATKGLACLERLH
eukprot:Skav223674  [mRNA]  locus=scaffold2691:81394:82005:+ [translate_table: standard]